MNTTIRMPATSSTTFSDDQLFISRELSWLDFNNRVLDEAGCNSNFLLEKLKFIAIFSSNLDEFFMVRVAGLRRLILAEASFLDPAGNTPLQQLHLAKRKISGMLRKQYDLLLKKIIPELNREGIFINKIPDMPAAEQNALRKIFQEDILPALTPLALNPDKPFPQVNSGAIEIAVSLDFPHRAKKITAFVEVPELLDRFVRVPDTSLQKFVLLEDLIAENIETLFPGGRVTAMQIFRITRDMDYSVDRDDPEDLIHELLNKLHQSSRRTPVRLELSSERCDDSLKKSLVSSLQLEPDLCYTLPGPLHLKQFADIIPLLDRQDLMEPACPPVTPELFKRYNTVFDAISEEKNIMLAHPYQSFDPILRLLEEAADDPDVLAIKQTLYRVSGNSPVINALRRAAENGKQVTVLVELKARFDESNNIAWAELLDLSGAHVVYGVAGLKVHCKTLLIIRRENGKLRKYVHFGTGNYNDSTAKQYSDISLLSCAPDLAADAAALFNLLSGGADPPDKWRAISTAPFDLREKLVRFIKTETARGKKGRIIAKMNSFSDPQLIRLIHCAADAGVKIDLIVRGICCCRPKRAQKNLRIISIIDRFLEHSRIFYFGTGDKLFCSSADWMPRNLDRRIETMFPIRDSKHKKDIMTILDFHLTDNCKQRKLTASGNYIRCSGLSRRNNRSQMNIYNMFNPAEK